MKATEKQQQGIEQNGIDSWNIGEGNPMKGCRATYDDVDNDSDSDDERNVQVQA